MKLEPVDNLLTRELKDLLSAEKQLVKALPKMAKGAPARRHRLSLNGHGTLFAFLSGR